MKIVFLGLSITSSWGNGHATTYRALVRALIRRGHEVLFLERDMPWYAQNRDLPRPPDGRTHLYADLNELRALYAAPVRRADLVIVGSYVPQGVEVGEWVLDSAGGLIAFYDIDTPVTLAKLAAGDYEYITPELIARYDLYLTFAGGPTIDRLMNEYEAPLARPLYCSVDPEAYFPEPGAIRWDLGYLGTYSDDRQPPLERLMLTPAREWAAGRFVAAGPMYPASVQWPPNLERIEHLPPAEHREFYCPQRFTLNVTRAAMIRAGYSPSVRLFEAAACGVPIISDAWEGLDAFLRPGEEILIAHTPEDTLRYLRELPEAERIAIGRRARARVLREHTADHRARELELYASQAASAGVRSRPLRQAQA